MTHGITFLPQCDVIIVMVDGRISEVGSYTDLVNKDGPFAQFLHIYKGPDESESESDEDEDPYMRFPPGNFDIATATSYCKHNM